MPLTPHDRRFLHTIDRLKIYLLVLALAVFLFLLCTPAEEIRIATSVIGLALCAVFWLTQRLLGLITRLDFELTRTLQVLKRTLPKNYSDQ